MSNEDPPFCRCPDGIRSVLRTVRKPGLNLGRKFYGCSRYGSDDACSFCSWKNSSPVQPDAPECMCHIKAVLRTANTDRNRGRQFFTCAQRICRFFQWIDDERQKNAQVSNTLVVPNSLPLPEVIIQNEYASCSFSFVTTQIKSVEASLSDKDLISHTPDNGARLRKKLQLLQEALVGKSPSHPSVKPYQSAPKSLSSVRPANPSPEIDALEASLANLSVKSRIPEQLIQPTVSETHLQSLNDLLAQKNHVKEISISADLLTPLYQYQKLGVSWMYHRENAAALDQPQGGIIADDMGLGKTVQMLALILSSHPVERQNADHTGLIPSKATLVVCPLAVITQWRDEIVRHSAPDCLSVTVHHGTRRSQDSSALSKFDVVITTYQVVVSSFKSERDKTLHCIRWSRVVLDEAHIIKNFKTISAKATYHLKSIARWYMSATPLQNELADLYSALKFLQFAPFDNHFYWKKLFGTNYAKKQSVDRLRPVLQSVMIRRTKTDRGADGKLLVQLPPRNVTVHRLTFSIVESRSYHELEAACKKEFLKFRDRKEGGYGAVLTAILRLRQFCNGIKTGIDLPRNSQPVVSGVCSDLETSFLKLAIKSPAELQTLPSPDPHSDVDSGCPICCDPISDLRVRAPCGHHYCIECIFPALDEKAQCPICRKPLSKSLLTSVTIGKDKPLAESQNADFRDSPKIAYLLKELEAIRDSQSGDKSVIFSQWTTMIDMIGPVLTESGYRFVRLDGTMTREARQKAIDQFNADTAITVFLLSLKCAGVGLNLTVANHCFALDVWWNGSVEEQAFDRIYRIGQTKPVFIHRLIIEKSVEERILSLQDRKQRLAKDLLVDSLSTHKENPSKLVTMEYLGQLFR
uniref:Uncharacterized protein n=1 Tax=Spongospora subterranea TaxID=70186 RepID=A0A0H5QNI6_9EUKA|eukprot:CRZ03142.1 hypothetical protein [Spongospora subterranea]